MPYLGSSIIVATSRQQCYSATEGLDWIHDQGVIHRDLKAENLGIQSVCPIRGIILDSGIAIQGEESIDYWPGTRNCQAPEVIRMQLFIDPSVPFTNKVDMYAMGVTVYQLMFKITVFVPLDVYSNETGKSMSVFDRGLTDARMWLMDDKSAIDIDIRHLIIRMVRDKPADRPTAKTICKEFDAIRLGLGPEKEKEKLRQSEREEKKMEERTEERIVIRSKKRQNVHHGLMFSSKRQDK